MACSDGMLGREQNFEFAAYGLPEGSEERDTYPSPIFKCARKCSSKSLPLLIRVSTYKEVPVLVKSRSSLNEDLQF